MIGGLRIDGLHHLEAVDPFTAHEFEAVWERLGGFSAIYICKAYAAQHTRRK